MSPIIIGILLGFNVAIWLAVNDLRTRVNKLAQSVLTLCEALQHLATALNSVQAIMKQERGRWN